MKFNNHQLITVLAVSFALGLAWQCGQSRDHVDLGSAANFAVLAATPNITNTGSTVITESRLSRLLAPALSDSARISGGTIYAVDAAGPLVPLIIRFADCG